jgi:nicotinamide mononucleotide transporter
MNCQNINKLFNNVIKSFKILFKSIYPDLKCFNIYESIILFILFALIVSFSIIDFNAIIHHNTNNTSIIAYTNCINQNNGQWKCSMLTLSGLASFTGILAVVLTSKRKISTFFWGVINNFVLGLFAFAYGYVGNAQIYILFAVPIQFVGMYAWSNVDVISGELIIEVKKLDWKKRIIYVIIFVVIGVCFYFEIPALSIAITGTYPYSSLLAPHILDALSNSLIVIGNILMILQVIEQWFFWFVLDVIVITMYSGIGSSPDFNILVMACVYLLNSIYGFSLWLKNYMKQRNETIEQIMTV